MHTTAAASSELLRPVYVPWGMLAAIDLHGCERRRLESPESIRSFVATLADTIDLEPRGPLVLERLGNGALEGWSAAQLLETSSITLHADEASACCFVDVLSCRGFDAEVAAGLAAAYFGGLPTVTVLRR